MAPPSEQVKSEVRELRLQAKLATCVLRLAAEPSKPDVTKRKVLVINLKKEVALILACSEKKLLT